MVVWTKRPVPESRIVDAELVFAGYGVVAPEYGWNDYAGIDMRGKIAVVLVNDPGYAHAGPETLHRQHDDVLRPLDVQVRGSGAPGRRGPVRGPRNEGGRLPVGRRAQRRAEAAVRPAPRRLTRTSVLRSRAGSPRRPRRSLLAFAGKDFASLKRGRGRAQFPRACRSASRRAWACATMCVTQTRTTSSAWCAAARRPDEHFVYTAHWDHLGQAADGPSQTRRGHDFQRRIGQCDGHRRADRTRARVRGDAARDPNAR